MIEALPPSARIRLFREVTGPWKALLWPAQTVATKLALLLGELDDPNERFELVVDNDHAALLVTQGYGALVSELLDACAPEQLLKLLRASELVSALCDEEGSAAVAARMLSLPPKERILLLAHPLSLGSWVAAGLAADALSHARRASTGRPRSSARHRAGARRPSR
jgi:hypothetical protein